MSKYFDLSGASDPLDRTKGFVPRRNPDSAGRENPQGKLKKVLIVEDSQIQAEMYRLVFATDKCKIIFAENGKEALEVLTRELNVDLIITDINMPEMNGIDFLTMVRRTGLAKCPIIVTSTPENKDLLEKAVESGASSYMVKPWDLRELRALVKRLVG